MEQSNSIFKPFSRRQHARRRPLLPYEDTRIGRRTGFLIPRIEPEEDGFEDFAKLMLLCDKLYPFSVKDILASSDITVTQRKQNRAGDHSPESSNVVIEKTEVLKILKDADLAQTPVLDWDTLPFPNSASEVTLCDLDEADLPSKKDYLECDLKTSNYQSDQKN